MIHMKNEKMPGSWLDRPFHPSLPAVTIERLIFAVILILAVVSRLYDLGVRVMSHDESLHTYFSWLFYKGDGYQHNPMMHGPLQFHLIALSYFLFGPSDFSPGCLQPCSASPPSPWPGTGGATSAGPAA